ncbi:Zn-ribbon domain-containing OB-fold protein [Haloarcula marina]|uniref:Zn-ribbon domain-containing OB-fold protein n=1 Tax=Haloarcula marina TaxID=2961574 RepID=UPI0020B8FB22|nr:OB-fold domain-containing protein [Halomicroarcula marina]
MTLEAGKCPNGHVSYPTHPRCPDCGEPQEETLNLAEKTGEVVTWTTSTATPPGVRQPNTMAIVEFDVDGQAVRALGQVTTDDVETGDEVEPVYVEELRDPEAGIRVPESMSWDGYRWEPV